MIDIGKAIRHYKRRDIQEEIIHEGQNKEIAARFGDSFGKRPDILKYPRDILEMAQNGATSFHASEEIWKYPLRLSPMMGKQEIEELRIGWDLILDIDCALLEYSRIAADEIVKTLKNHNLSPSVKYSGNKGFHIGLPFEAFPEKINNKEARLVFPEAARIVALYIKEMTNKQIARRLLGLENITRIIAKTGKPLSEYRLIAADTEKEAESKILSYIQSFLNIDTVLISTRHLYRMTYSLHEKSGLVSTPVDPNKIMDFDTNDAKPENVSISKHRFLNRNADKNDARELFDQAFYTFLSQGKAAMETGETKAYIEPEGAIPIERFPPCILKILEGMEDGRKRGLFILINFLSSSGWGYKDIEKTAAEWNKKNKTPLSEAYVQGQLLYYKQKKKKVLPPNCSNTGYYSDMGIKCPEQICSLCKNPVVFAKKRMRYVKG